MPTIAVAPPKTYSEWTVVLDMLRARTDDEAVLAAMRQGSLEWQAGVAERFVKKLLDSVNCRMNVASDRFQKEITRSGGQERGVVQALLALRRELEFLAEAIDIPAIPEKERQRYRQLVFSQADSMQAALENSAKKDRSGRLASIVRNNKVNKFCEGVHIDE